jgi:hypothetical protein
MELSPAAYTFLQDRPSTSRATGPRAAGPRPNWWREHRQTNLAVYKRPIVLSSYEARTVCRPGNVAEWAQLISRMAMMAEGLYRDARVLTSKRQQMWELPPSSPTFLEAQRVYGEVERRAVRGCQDLAHLLLATGLSREHLDQYLARCGMENYLQPDYRIALLYSKLMGIPFAEERMLPPGPGDGPNSPPRYVSDERCFHWAQQIEPGDLDDFYWTMRTLQEQLPSLAAKFQRFANRRTDYAYAA